MLHHTRRNALGTLRMCYARALLQASPAYHPTKPPSIGLRWTLRFTEFEAMQYTLHLQVRGSVRFVFSAALLACLACKGSKGPQFLTETVGRGDIRESIFATGEVSALTKVNVGSQVSGTIARLLVDYNSSV